MTRPGAQLDREIADAIRREQIHAQRRQAVESFANSPQAFNLIKTGPRSLTTHRWVGKCKRCGHARQLVGYVAMAYLEDASGSVKTLGEVAVADDGVYVVADLGTNPTKVVVPCGDHRCTLQRVFDDAKPNRPRSECGARCINATGPSCDCRCKGENHGSRLPAT